MTTIKRNHFDLTNSTPKNTLRPVARGILRLQLDFSANLTEPLSVLIFTEGIGILEISNDRTIEYNTTLMDCYEMRKLLEQKHLLKHFNAFLYSGETYV